MSTDSDLFRPREYTAADHASVEERADFIIKTYLHLFGAIIAFIGIEFVLLNLSFTDSMVETMLTFAGGYSWLVILGAFMLVSYIANGWAHSDTGVGVQYAGLGLFIAGESIIFLPLLYIAAAYGGTGVIQTAGVATFGIFTALTAIVFFTRKNFSFLGPFLALAGIVALGLIVVSIVFGFALGPIFTVAMIGFAGAYILYDTSNILHEYRVGQHVAASLALFASVALLFWYILQLFMSRR